MTEHPIPRQVGDTRIMQRTPLTGRDRAELTALHSGDVTKPEMDELVLHFAGYYGFAKAEALRATAEASWGQRPQRRAE